MLTFLLEYGLFALKTVTLVLLVGALLTFAVASISRPGSAPRRQLEILKLNDDLREEREALESALLDETAAAFAHKQKRAKEKAERKVQKKKLKKERKNGEASAEPVASDVARKKHVFILDFDGDLQASAVENLRREITAVLSVAGEADEVVVRLESGGGMVHAYGLAASQLARIRAHSVPLTVCVDKIAASGGYMMACVANKIYAAPFAVLGSIGVVAQIPNFNRLLKKHDVDLELLTAGEHKRTLTVLGRNTEKGRQKFQSDLEATHDLFKGFISEQRPQLKVNEVATGETWYGTQAKELCLIDEIGTSDDYLSQLSKEAELFEIHYKERQGLREQILSSVETATERVVSRIWHRATTQTFHS